MGRSSGPDFRSSLKALYSRFIRVSTRRVDRSPQSHAAELLADRSNPSSRGYSARPIPQISIMSGTILGRDWKVAPMCIARTVVTVVIATFGVPGCSDGVEGTYKFDKAETAKAMAADLDKSAKGIPMPPGLAILAMM